MGDRFRIVCAVVLWKWPCAVFVLATFPANYWFHMVSSTLFRKFSILCKFFLQFFYLLNCSFLPHSQVFHFFHPQFRFFHVFVSPFLLLNLFSFFTPSHFVQFVCSIPVLQVVSSFFLSRSPYFFSAFPATSTSSY